MPSRVSVSITSEHRNQLRLLAEKFGLISRVGDHEPRPSASKLLRGIAEGDFVVIRAQEWEALQAIAKAHETRESA